MITDDREKSILKKVKQLEIKVRGIVNQIFSGEYHSVFKGRGMNFAEVREYSYGDDVRTIDWNVTARHQNVYIKQFEEERELVLMLLVDVSKSNFFGSKEKLKHELMAEIAAVLAFSALKNNDKVGLLLFSDKIEKYIPPQKGKTHIFRIIRELLYYNPESSQTDISIALGYFINLIKKRSIAFLLSDFYAPSYQDTLRIASKKHDITAISFYDQKERDLPPKGLYNFYDNETQEEILIDLSSNINRNIIQESRKNYLADMEKTFLKNNVDHISIEINSDYIKPLSKFFKKRERKIH